MLTLTPRTLTVTPVVSRDPAEMRAQTDDAWARGDESMWQLYEEEGTVGLTSKERMVYLYWISNRNAANVEKCCTFLGMDRVDVCATTGRLREIGHLKFMQNVAKCWYADGVQREGLIARNTIRLGKCLPKGLAFRTKV
ncbi:MAG: hypothetical protein AUG51_16220 [Acidobacteria bacterium 13_1_20CM_3_53_8]|nr:MAG: hypothetical protein AUG51_16220 [Acidobacteria bacterium 13_1_20CM_3_53_8]